MSAITPSTPTEWVVLAFGLISAVAAWFGAIVSWKNLRRIAIQDRVCIQLAADHESKYHKNGTRDIDDEFVRIRLFNRGRAIEIEKIALVIMLRRKVVTQLGRSLGTSWQDQNRDHLNLFPHESHVAWFRVNELWPHLTSNRHQAKLNIQLRDGCCISKEPKSLAAILESLYQLKSDIESGCDLLLPDILIRKSEYKHSRQDGDEWYYIDNRDKEIPADAEIRYDDRTGLVSDDVAEAVRAGRDPQHEQISASRARRGAKMTFIRRVFGPN